MLRAAVDSTVFVSAVSKHGPGALKVYAAWREHRFDLITSEPILVEVDRVLAKQEVPESDRSELDSALRASAVVVAPDVSITDCRDPDDNKLLEAAVAGAADCIVTDDKDLRVLSPFRGIEVVTVNRFLRRLGFARRKRM